MNLAIVGYGKMGRLIEQLAPEYGFAVKLRLDIDNNANYEGMTEENFRGIDAAVEFSTPATAIENIERLARLGVNSVIGTTGWFGELDRARAAVERGGTGLVWSANFSVGVHIFSQIVAEAARLMARQPEYGAWAWEIHHATKKDAPSGTLLALVERMKQSGYDQRIDTSSSRAGARSRHARNRLRFCGGHDHDPPHGAQPRRLRARGLARRALGGRQKRLFRFSRNRERDGMSVVGEEGGTHMFTGCGTALVTPFRQDQSLDEQALRRLVKRQIDAGINFLVPCGTTGESPTLTHARAPPRRRDHHRRGARQGARRRRRRRLQHRGSDRARARLRSAWARTASSPSARITTSPRRKACISITKPSPRPFRCRSSSTTFPAAPA